MHGICVEKVSPHSTYDASISLPLITITFAACARNKHFDDNQALSQKLMYKNQQKYKKKVEKKTPKNEITTSTNRYCASEIVSTSAPFHQSREEWKKLS